MKADLIQVFDSSIVIRQYGLSDRIIIHSALYKMEKPFDGNDYIVLSSESAPEINLNVCRIYPASGYGHIDHIPIKCFYDNIDHNLILKSIGYNLIKTKNFYGKIDE